MRRLWLLWIPALLAGCDTSQPRGFVMLTLRNFGNEPAAIEIDVSHSEDDAPERHDVLAQNTIRSYSFTDVDRLALRVYRISDLFKIFDDFWKPNDLRRLNDNVVVTVEP